MTAPERPKDCAAKPGTDRRTGGRKKQCRHGQQAPVRKGKSRHDAPPPGVGQRAFDHAMPGIGMDEARPAAPRCDWMPRCLATLPGPHPEQQHIARSPRPAEGLGAKPSSPPPATGLRRARLGPVRRIGWHDLRLGPVKRPPDPTQQAQAIGARALATGLMHIGRADPAPRLGHNLIGLASVEVPPCSDPPDCPARHADRTSANPHREYAESHENSAGWRTSTGRSPTACRSPPSSRTRSPGRKRGPDALPQLDPAGRRPRCGPILTSPDSPAAAPVSTSTRPNSNQRSSKPPKGPAKLNTRLSRSNLFATAARQNSPAGSGRTRTGCRPEPPNSRACKPGPCGWFSASVKPRNSARNAPPLRLTSPSDAAKQHRPHRRHRPS